MKWANSYSFGYDKFEVAPRVANDGAIYIVPWGLPSNKKSILIKIAADGSPAWATNTEGASIMLPDFSGAARSYELTGSYLFATAGRLVGVKLHSFVLAINSQTGKIEKQVELSAPGGSVLWAGRKTRFI